MHQHTSNFFQLNWILVADAQNVKCIPMVNCSLDPSYWCNYNSATFCCLWKNKVYGIVGWDSLKFLSGSSKNRGFPTSILFPSVILLDDFTDLRKHPVRAKKQLSKTCSVPDNILYIGHLWSTGSCPGVFARLVAHWANAGKQGSHQQCHS